MACEHKDSVTERQVLAPGSIGSMVFDQTCGKPAESIGTAPELLTWR